MYSLQDTCLDFIAEHIIHYDATQFRGGIFLLLCLLVCSVFWIDACDVCHVFVSEFIDSQFNLYVYMIEALT